MSNSRGCRDEAPIAVEPPANVLCRAPSFSPAVTEVCPEIGPDGDRNLLLVSLSGTPERRLGVWKRHGDLPRNVAVLSVEQPRGAAAAGSTGGTRGPGGSTLSTATVSEPGDLTGIGIKVNQCLSAWEDDDDVRTHVCFDSVTTLLQYVDTRRAFRFLHVLSRRVQSVGALAHYHVDPGAHDEQTLATIEGVFSDVFEYDEATDCWTAF